MLWFLENYSSFLWVPDFNISRIATQKMLSLLARIGRFTLERLAGMGRMFLFLFSAFAWALRPPTRIRLILYHIKSIGVDSLSVVLLSGVFTGMVMGLQGYYSLRKFNAESFLGSAVALGLLRELGPVLSAFMVTGRTGSAMAAEIGSMKVTEQIDALYSMAINPIQYLVSPRIIAGLISMRPHLFGSILNGRSFRKGLAITSAQVNVDIV